MLMASPDSSPSAKPVSAVKKDPFRRVSLTTDQSLALNALTDAFKGVYSAINSVCKDGRYKSLAITALESAAMWASKSFTHETVEGE